MMIEPSKVKAAAKAREDENLKFRSFLKNRADEDNLDRQFLKLHNELFSGYDCCKCNNCCRAYGTTVQEYEFAPIAGFLGVTEEEFAKEYLFQGAEGYELKGPCKFLNEDGKCAIYECRPEECRDFPYTDKPGRLWSLYGVLEFAGECPIVFEILERLKDIYRFRR